ncbi:MAG: 50S ribosomal protein L31 [Acidobacteria bacterium]|nr:MAG: 50S ribosomal protein L31 [Acidobacteriota bacterium]
MKSGIHPVYKVVTVTCACGESFVTRSTKDDMRLEICAKCHPFFTGKQKLIDSAGRVERFERRYKNVPKEGAPAADRTEPRAAGKVAAPSTGRTNTPSAGKSAGPAAKGKAGSTPAEGKGTATGA